MRVPKFAFVAAGALVVAASGLGPVTAAEVYVLDQKHTYITFIHDRMGYTNILGRFDRYEGEIVFDEEDLANSSVSVTIFTNSLSTGYARRDEDLIGPNFFNAKEFPEITFKSTKVVATGPKTGKITGDLTLLGVTKPVTLDVTFNKKAPSPRNKKIFIGFAAEGEFNRVDYGMTYLTNGDVQMVGLRLEVLAVLKE